MPWFVLSSNLLIQIVSQAHTPSASLKDFFNSRLSGIADFDTECDEILNVL